MINRDDVRAAGHGQDDLRCDHLGNDYNLALVALLLATALVLVANLLADIAYAALDPRVTYRAGAGMTARADQARCTSSPGTAGCRRGRLRLRRFLAHGRRW